MLVDIPNNGKIGDLFNHCQNSTESQCYTEKESNKINKTSGPKQAPGLFSQSGLGNLSRLSPSPLSNDIYRFVILKKNRLTYHQFLKLVHEHYFLVSNSCFDFLFHHFDLLRCVQSL